MVRQYGTAVCLQSSALDSQWCSRPGLNCQPFDPQSNTLTITPGETPLAILM